MDIEGKRIWQHAAGDPDHDHVDISLQWDVILTGDGSEEWSSDQRAWQRNEVRYFCDDMRSGDIAVLKLGQRDVYGVGLIGEYKWCDEFNDVDGWTLGHTRRIQWIWKYTCDNGGKPHSFDARLLARSTTSRLHKHEVKQWLRTLEARNSDLEQYEYVTLPEQTEPVTNEDIAKYLFGKGVASDSIRNLLEPNGSFVQMASWYDNSEIWPKEHETVCHLIVPLLKILGWTPQRIALEWNNIDVALFRKIPRSNDELAVVVEAKRVHAPCLNARGQAEKYAKKLPNCSRIILSDGLRYGIFNRNRANDQFSLYAYLNLVRPRGGYSIYNCNGAKEAIFAMTPDWSGERDGIRDSNLP